MEPALSGPLSQRGGTTKGSRRRLWIVADPPGWLEFPAARVAAHRHGNWGGASRVCSYHNGQRGGSTIEYCLARARRSQLL